MKDGTQTPGIPLKPGCADCHAYALEALAAGLPLRIVEPNEPDPCDLARADTTWMAAADTSIGTPWWVNL